MQAGLAMEMMESIRHKLKTLFHINEDRYRDIK